MSRVYIAAGSNLGNRLQHLEEAYRFLCREKSLAAIQAAPVYETAPVGGPQQGDFLNTLWIFETAQSPEFIFKILQAAETSQGRVRAEKNGPRIIDLDLVAYDDVCVSREELCIPHARMHQRWFVLKPFCDVQPEWKHPVLKKTAAELLEALSPAEAGALYKVGKN